MMTILSQQDSNDKTSQINCSRLTGFNSSFIKKTNNIPSYVFDPSQPNPQEKAETENYVEKLRSKKKKQNRVPFIRKS